MKNTVLKSFIMLGFFFAFTSCSEKNEQPKSNEAKLPEISFEGKQFIACKVNGKLFISQSRGGIGMNNRPDADIYLDSILFINGEDADFMKRAFIGLAVVREAERTKYPLSYRYAHYRTWFTDNSPLGGRQFNILESEPHEMEILYEDEDIIAGTFYFTALSQDGDTVCITDGRFDLKKRL